MSPNRWTFQYEVRAGLPPLAWAAWVGDGRVRVRCGTSVRRADDGFVEGTWQGGSALGSLVTSTTVFGAGLVDVAGSLYVVPPSHTLEAVYLFHGRRQLVVSNSLVGLLSAAGIELDPTASYPPLFLLSTDGPVRPLQALPSSGGDIVVLHYENLRVGGDGGTAVERRPREAPFVSFADYRDRLSAVLAAAIRNAPGYEPLAAMSSGYDGTAVAAVAAGHGLRRAVTLRTGKPVPGSDSLDDSGLEAATALGLTVETYERLAYRDRDDLAEAEFLASGMSGEDVMMAAMEPALHRTLLLSGHYGDLMWDRTTLGRSEFWRGDMSGCSLTDFRLRLDFVHLPLPVFGRVQQRSLPPISSSREMRPWSVGGDYDRPIARRLIEDAGVPRGAFATGKRSASATLHREGLVAFAPATREALLSFAAAEGRPLAMPLRRLLRRYERAAIRAARSLRLGRLAARLAARKYALMTFEPEPGSLVLRWAVSVVRPRYSELRPSDAAAAPEEAAAADATRNGELAATVAMPPGGSNE